MKDIAKLGEASVRRVYGDFSGTQLRGWSAALAEHGLVPHQVAANIPGKNATDIALAIDAMDLLHSGRFAGFCLVSSDSDFTRLATRIPEQGLTVYGFGGARTPVSFVAACKQFFFIEPMLPEAPKTPKTAKRKKKAAEPAPELPLEDPAPEPVAKPEPDQGIRPVAEVLPALHAAVAALADEEGWTRLDKVGVDILARTPGFRSNRYGHAKLSTLIERSGAFEMRRGHAKIIHIRSIGEAARDWRDRAAAFDSEGVDDPDEIPF